MIASCLGSCVLILVSNFDCCLPCEIFSISQGFEEYGERDLGQSV